MAVYKNKTIEDLYRAKAEAKVNNLQKARIEAETKLNMVKPNIKQQYNSKSAQLDALVHKKDALNNERLAGMGLAAGFATKAISGYSEDARENSEKNFGSGILEAKIGEKADLEKVNSDVLSNKLKFDKQKVEAVTSMNAQKEKALISAYKMEVTDTIRQGQNKQKEQDFALGLINKNSALISIDAKTKQAAVKDKNKLIHYINSMNYSGEMRKFLFKQYNL